MLPTISSPVNSGLTEIDDLLRGLAPLLDRVPRGNRFVKLRRDTATQKAGETKCEHKPLTDAAMRDHLSGKERHGVYPMASGETVTCVGVFDLDSHKGESMWAEMQAAALRVMDHAERAALRPIPFRSGGGSGVHIYLLWDAPQDAYSVREAMRAVLASAGFKEGNIGGIAAGNAEIFPKQDVCSTTGVGFYLPLGGKSVPLDGFELDDMPRDWVTVMDWPTSDPVPVLERPAYTARESEGEVVGLETLQQYAELLHVHGERFDYDAVQRLNAAFYHVSGGDERAMHLFEHAIAKFSGFNAAFTQYKWDSYSRGYTGATAGIGTIKTIAAQLDQEAANDIELAEASNDFEALPGEPVSRPAYQRDSNGKVLALVGNVVKALRFPFECGARIARDEFRAQNMVDGRVATDEDITELQMRLEARDFLKLGKDLVRDAFYKVAYENAYDSAIQWIGTLQWDGVPRVERFLIERFGADDTPYTRAVSRYMWTALAGRALKPGIQADMVPTLVGPQGIGKTQGVKAIAPAPELFCELGFAERDVEASRKMRGRLVIELGELRGMSARDVEGVKAFITRQTELFRDLYRNNMVEFHRRHLFIGTTNKDQFLSDDTGERRWLPVRVTKCDPPAIERDRDQLWAEAVVAFQQQGVAWQDAQRLASGEHDEFKLQDEWEPTVLAWMHEDEGFGSGVPAARGFLRTDEVLIGALRFEAKTIRPGDAMRIAAILKRQQYERAQIRINGRKTWVFVRSQDGDLA